MSISEQVKELRDKADIYNAVGSAWELNRAEAKRLQTMLREAANTIEALSAKLAAANEELERWHTDKVNEKIKNPFAWTSTLCCHNCDHKDEYIEELEASDMERSVEDCGGGWIPCKDRLPEEKGWYLVYAKNQRPFVAYFKGKTFPLNNHYHEIIAWQPLPEPYHEP